MKEIRSLALSRGGLGARTGRRTSKCDYAIISLATSATADLGLLLNMTCPRKVEK